MMYTNPHLTHTIAEWPTGRYTTTALFSIETHKSGKQRAVRITHHPLTGKPAAPKKLTYADQVRIVDGEDGRTYLLEYSCLSQALSVMQGNMQYQQEYITREDPRYTTLCSYFSEEV